MKKLPLFLFIALLAILPLLRSQAAAAPREKVILDTDMVEAFDDGVAMTMLANAPGIELMGVTCVTGNSWVQDGVAYALRQLEIEGKDIPVAVGMRYPLRPQRHALFELERKLCGMGHDAWLGSLNQPEPKSWEAAYQKHYGKASRFKPIAKHAVNFIIDTVRANPNQVTIAAIGPCTNLAAAIRMDPDIVPLIKRIVYMGGSFFKPGNVTPSAEFNWWIDPEAAQIVVRAPFKEQVVFGLDVCEKVIFRKAHYERLLRTLGGGEQAQLLRQSFPGRRARPEETGRDSGSGYRARRCGTWGRCNPARS